MPIFTVKITLRTASSPFERLMVNDVVPTVSLQAALESVDGAKTCPALYSGEDPAS